MGLATLPSPRIKLADDRSQTASFQDSVCPDDFSCRRQASEHQEIQEVSEVPETTKKKDHTGCGDETRMLNCSENKAIKGCRRQKSHSSMLIKSKEFAIEAFEVPDSRKDLSPEFLQDSVAVFTKPPQAMNCAPSPPHKSKIRTLRPSEGTKRWKDEVRRKSSKIERNPDKFFHIWREPTGSQSREQNSVSLPLNSPARIVILQPSLTDKRAEANYFIHYNLFFSPTRVAASGVQELNNHGRHKHRLLGSRGTATGITKKMRQAMSNNTKKNLTSEMSTCTGVTNSSLQGNQKLNDKSSNNSTATSSCSVESSVNKETRNRVLKKWKIAHRLQRLTHLGSSRRGEILAQADKETNKDRMNISNFKSVSNRKLASKKAPTTKGHLWGINSKNGSKDGNFTFVQSSKSFPDFLSVELSDRKQDGSKCKRNTIRYINEKEPSVSKDGKFWKPGMMLVESSTHHVHNSQRTHSFVDEIMLNERDTHVNSEEVRKNIRLKHFIEERTFDPAPSDCAVGQKNQDISSDHSHVEQLPSKSHEAGSHHQSSNVLEKLTPVSLLETPSEDVTFSLECLERLSVNLKEFQMQLQLLKLETVDIHTEEKDALRDADCAGAVGDSNVLLASGEAQQLTDDDERDFFYLLDMVIESGIDGLDENKLSDTSYLLDYPVNQNVFNKLEKKYKRGMSWSISERKLLFDQINCILEEIVIKYMDVHPWVSPKINQPAWDFEDLIEYMWLMVVKQKMQLDCNHENKVLEPGWFDLEFEVNSIGENVERMLTDELLQEVLRDFLFLA